MTYNAKHILYNLVYVVTMYRWGSREGHSYLVGVFYDLEKAKIEAEKEREHRGGKYEWIVQAMCLDKDVRSSYEDCKMKIVAKSKEMDVHTDDERLDVNDKEKLEAWYKHHGKVNAKEELTKLDSDIEVSERQLGYLKDRKEKLLKRIKE